MKNFVDRTLVCALLAGLAFPSIGCSAEPEQEKSAISYKREPPIVKKEMLPPSEGYPHGLLKMQMEGVYFEIPADDFIPLSLHETLFDYRGAWDTKKRQFVRESAVDSDRKARPNLYGVTLQFRASRKPFLNYWENKKADPYISPNHKEGDYEVRLSAEYPDTYEFYLPKLDTAHTFLLDYTDDTLNRHVVEKIFCFSDFREKEKEWDTPNNGGCTYGFTLSPQVVVTVLLDSRILHQIKDFEKAIYQLVDKFIVNNESEGE